jgi:membrane protease subunit (stomatin/prohibitin family)
MAGITQIIRYEGDSDTFIRKHPAEDFAAWSQLIVHESQEAIFFLNGQALDLFGPGRHTLDAQSIPLVSRILNKPAGDSTPFHCEIYFINKTEQPAIKWGTDSRIQYMEPVYHFPLQIGASGEMSLRVDDSRKLLVKITGTEKTFDKDALVRMFRAFLQVRIKPHLARIMQDGKISIFETDMHIGELSETLHAQLLDDFSDYGLVLERFFVTAIAKPDGDRAYEKFKEIHLRQYADIAEAQIRQKVGLIEQQTEAQKMVIEAEALAEKRKREGFTYQQERSFDVAEKVAQNEAVGNYSNLGIGLGMMGGIAGGMGATVAGITSGALRSTGAATEQTASAGETAGTDAAPSNPPKPDNTGDMSIFKQKVEKLKILKEEGLLSDEEFEREKKKILETL